MKKRTRNIMEEGNNYGPIKPSALQPEAEAGAGAIIQARTGSCCKGSVPDCSTPFTRLMKPPAQTFSKGWPVFLFFLFLTFCFTPAAGTQEEDVMHFPDRNLEAAVRAALERPGGILTPADMQTLTELEAGQYEIRHLTGLEYAVNLESLSLYNNDLEDLSPLADLKALRLLNLRHNRIRDLTPLSGLKNLETLNLEGNLVANLAPLVGLSGKLTRLTIPGNRYDDIAHLGKLTGLEYLELGNEQVHDIGDLAALTGLKHLTVTGTHVSDIEPLEELALLEWLSLEGNIIEDLSPLTALNKLEYLNLNNNRIRCIQPLSPLDNLSWLEICCNYLDMEEGTPEAALIQGLLEKNAVVNARPQLLPWIRGDGSVRIPEGEAWKMAQTPTWNRLTILNPDKGWRIQSFTVEQQGAGPRDYLREIGHASPGASRFAWYSTPGRYRPRVDDDFPYTVTFQNPTVTRLGLSVQIWPASPDNGERLFYVSEIVLWNIHTRYAYTLELEPPGEHHAFEPGLQPGESARIPETGNLRIEAID